MRKWLAITLIVSTGFFVILLGLGYLLSENEKATTLLKKKLEQEAKLAQGISPKRDNKSHYRKMLSVIDNSQEVSKTAPKQVDAKIKKVFEHTLINHLTCVTVAQCQVVAIQFKNINCQVASNIIGASILKKIATQSFDMDACPSENPQSKLACQQNICTLIATAK